MEIGKRSQVLLGGAWDFLFLGKKEREEFTQRTQRVRRGHRVRRSAKEKERPATVGGPYSGEN